MSVDSLEWPVMVLAQLDVDFVIEGPAELSALLGRTAERFARAGVSGCGRRGCPPVGCLP